MVLVKTGIRTVLATRSAVLALAAAPPTAPAPTAHAALAAKLSKDIANAMRGRAGHIAIRVEDAKTGVECRYTEGSRSHSASVVKATILAALLYWRQRTHTSLTSYEKS